MKKKAKEAKFSFSKFFTIILISIFLFFAAYSTIICLLYITPTHQQDIPVTIVKTDSKHNSGGGLGNRGGTSYNISLQSHDGKIYNLSIPSKTYKATNLSGINNLKEFSLTLSKFISRPVAINIRSKATPKSGILERLVQTKEKPFVKYSLIDIPFIGAFIGAIIMWGIVIYLIWKISNMSSLDWVLHSMGYILATISGFMMAL